LSAEVAGAPWWNWNFLRRVRDLRTAYQVTGSGPVDLVQMAGYGSIDATWDAPEFAFYNRRLGEIARLGAEIGRA
jgi:hypothetical protein